MELEKKKSEDILDYMDLTPKERQGFEEIAHEAEIQHRVKEILKMRGIDLGEDSVKEVYFEVSYNSKKGEFEFAFIMRGLDAREV